MSELQQRKGDGGRHDLITGVGPAYWGVRPPFPFLGGGKLKRYAVIFVATAAYSAMLVADPLMALVFAGMVIASPLIFIVGIAIQILAIAVYAINLIGAVLAVAAILWPIAAVLVIALICRNAPFQPSTKR